MTSQLPSVYRPERTQTVYVTSEGIRDSRTIADKRTRVRVSMPAVTALGLCQLLGGVVGISGLSAAPFLNIAGGGDIGRAVVQLALHVVPEHLGAGFAVDNFKLRERLHG